ncbi:MAG: NUDIX hydrolase, partial [Propionibacteriales bacterium]|nr:NUDIX hydrolase [Propionibacteriales bacterium]
MAAILATRHERVVLILNHRFNLGVRLCEIPAGTLRSGEDPMRAGKRELREETGYEATSCHLVAQFYSSPGVSDELVHLFHAECATTVQDQKLDNAEEIAVGEFDVDQVRDLVATGGIRDAKTL